MVERGKDGWLNEEGVLALGSPLARRVEVHGEIDSTQRRARELAAGGAPEGTVVISRVQRGGKGRLGRAWGSPPGGLWMSLVLRPRIEAREAPRVTIVAAVAVAKYLRSIGVRAEIKWPNDLLAGGRKVCGILAESSLATGHGSGLRLDYVVLGIGLNADLDAADLDVQPGEATTVREQLGREVDLPDLLDGILSSLQTEMSRIRNFDVVLDNWRSMNCTVGRSVRVTTGNDRIEGVAVGITGDGAIVVNSGGRDIRFYEGDVENLRSHE